MNPTLTSRPAVAAALTLGIGLGGFFDGIVFHQILQIHNMLSGWLPVTDLVSAKTNMVWDGLFHAAVWSITLLGVVLLWRAGARGDVAFARRHLVGGLLLGWGLFNLVEGLIDHQLLGVHHVVERLGPSVWDYAFLAWGGAMIITGWLLVRPAPAPSAAAGSSG
ncbi:DUF2243 domain-containing protein [Phenylobacterium hankyongense]|uniref:DUF2243 domain-containing protein n=1 Tax=Phenylobacterium hankyongense TaxID=1813876 RepID=A0A328B1R4_9CAUL|nr:DUF2243 domain-containing protein [Phenylobacterium hankyongense]RAK59846.1 DUF2243 domain-containing protein [Phenylobacterium hankyongense]